MRNVKTSLAFFAALMLAACAAKSPKELHTENISTVLELYRSVPCCRPLVDISAKSALGVTEPQDFYLGEDRQRFATPSGNTYLAAIRLPDELDTYHFSIYSYPIETTNEKLIAVPIVLVLNEDFTVSRFSSINMLRYWKEEALWDKHERLNIFVKVDRKKNPSERYIVVTTDEKTYGQAITFSRTMGGGISVIPLGTTTAVVRNPSTMQNAKFVSSPKGVIRFTNLSSPMARPFDRFIYF